MVTTSTHSPSVESVMKLRDISKIFYIADYTDRAMLEDPNPNLCQGKAVVMLDESSPDKSTLLRIMAGPVRADHGQVLFHGRECSGPVQGIAVMLQSFTLLPWLAVQQNVELNLEAQGMPETERRERAEQVIDLIGLSGFNSALPHKLSGGMRQRVGIAHALVTEPDPLSMGGAFSTLGMLTDEDLRNGMFDLWEGRRTNIKSIPIVSHNIEGAMMMADRTVILSSDPRCIRAGVRVPFPRPRNRDSAMVHNLVDEVYGLITSPEHMSIRMGMEPVAEQLVYRLSDAKIGQMEAILDLLIEAPFDGRAGLPHLAGKTSMTDDSLLPACKVLVLLQLATTECGNIVVTPFGKTYMGTEPLKHKILFD